MTEIKLGDIADCFRHVRYTNYFHLLTKEYSTRFPSWTKIEFNVRELHLSEQGLPTNEKINFTTWGCAVHIKIPRDQESFIKYIRTSLENLAQRFQSDLDSPDS